MSLKSFAVATLCVAAFAAPASAAVFTDRAAFNAAATITDTADFEGKVAPGFDGVYYGDTAGNSGVLFKGVSAELQITRGDFAPGYFLAGDSYGSDYLGWSSSELTISFLDPVIAVGFDFMDELGRPMNFTIEMGGVTTNIVAGGTSKFFGMTSGTPFQSFTLKTELTTRGSPYPGAPTLDNLSYGYAPPVVEVDMPGVPEPGAWAMMLMGFGGMGALLRRRRALVALA